MGPSDRSKSPGIHLQPLTDAMTMSFAGRILVILLGTLIALMVRSVLEHVPAALSPLWVRLGVTISVTAGLFLANRAAWLDPIVCLRHE